MYLKTGYTDKDVKRAIHKHGLYKERVEYAKQARRSLGF